ncbi:MAG: thioesterase family protein [Ktedonobacteraceae bacterium]
MEDHYPSWYPVQIRLRDLDPLAHVNNTVYFIYFEEARSHYLDQLDPWLKQWPSEEEHQHKEDTEPENPRIQTGPRGHRYGMLVKEITNTYMLPLVRGDQAEVGVRVARVGRTSYIMEHLIRDMQEHERVFASGRSVMVWRYHNRKRIFSTTNGRANA